MTLYQSFMLGMRVFLFSSISLFASQPYENINKGINPILLYGCDQISTAGIKNLFGEFNIPYEEIQALNPTNDSHLHLIFNIADIPEQSLPTYYIVYNTVDLKNPMLTQDYIKKLSNAVVVWDNSWINIKKYRSRVHNYYYFSEKYKFVDPVILSCYLPVHTLNAYKEILIYSNTVNTDISSHLPSIFVYCILQKADIIVEAGVRDGESTIAFAKTLNFHDALLIGLDIENGPSKVYSKIKNSFFICMNDLDFPQYYQSNPDLKNHALDIIFIDTSHYYDQTLAEIEKFVPVLAANGFLLFHDSYMSPLPNFKWHCLNGTVFGGGWDNQQGVVRAIKEYFSISFDQTQYNNFEFVKDNTLWHIIHYPFSNGLTLIRKLGNPEGHQ